MKKPLWLVAWLLVIEVLVILLLVPGDWTDKTIQRESELVEQNLGYEARQWISDTAGDW
ncbi:conjugal transfer protein, partial [Vibrio parahaemolyticus]|nr:conjugal transfer protein [Vibrio parahaemolyticus]